MRELRTCPVTGRTVLINDAWLDAPPVVPPRGPCDFCTLHGPIIQRHGAVWATPHPNPALGVEGDARPQVEHGRVWRQAVGAHELLLGAHGGDDLPLLQLARLRIKDLQQDRRLRGFRLLRRHQPDAHAVWQLFALPVDVAPSAPAGWRDQELSLGVRVLARRGGAVAILSWAPRTPFETWILPERGRDGFGQGPLDGVAHLLGPTLTALGRALRGAPVDLVIEDGEPWRVELRPRLESARSVEVATELPLHGTFPEEAARFLRAMSACP